MITATSRALLRCDTNTSHVVTASADLAENEWTRIGLVTKQAHRHNHGILSADKYAKRAK